MLKLVSFLLFISISISQDIHYQKIDGFNFPLSTSHVIVKIKRGTLDYQLAGYLKPLETQVEGKLNEHGFYLCKIKNNSKTFYIFQKQIEKLKTISAIEDILPVFQFNDKFNSISAYSNSHISGFTGFKNDSLFNYIYQLKDNIRYCDEKSFRMNEKLVKYALVEFAILKGKTNEYHCIETDLNDEAKVCLERILNNQEWNNEQFLGKVKFLFIVTNK